jgi:stage V sporulation protein AC
MKATRQQYQRIYEQLSPSTKSAKNIPMAFLVGGLICALGQGLFMLYEHVGLAERLTPTAVSISLIFLGVLLTGVRLFEKIAKRAGAGTLVPITGFANSVAAPAIEFKAEGFVLGTCVKMFSIAGPVLTFGYSASVLYGVLYYVFTRVIH